MAQSRFPGNTGKRGEDTGSTFEHAAGEAKTKAQEAASAVGQKAQELGHRAQETAANVAGRAQEMASNIASQAKDRTEGAISGVGERMSSLAGTLRESAPQGGTLGAAAGAVADRLQAGGDYLKEHGLNDMADDFEAAIRQHPLTAVMIGFGVGCLVGMAFSRR